MRIILLILFVLLSFAVFSQKVSTFDIVKVDANFEKEAMYFYNND
jgi:parvulin-like peptidyl-prolyl isomerase